MTAASDVSIEPWESVTAVTPERPRPYDPNCFKCGSPKQVRTGRVFRTIATTPTARRVKIGRWCLCENCHRDGFRIELGPFPPYAALVWSRAN